MLPVGTPLSLVVLDGDEYAEETYRANVIDVRDQFIYIDYPIGEQTNKSAFLPIDAHVRISYVGKDKAVYTFATHIVSRVKLTIPALKLFQPDQTTIKKIQRRQYVRIDTAIDIAVERIEKGQESFTTVTLDISGGGLSVITQNQTLIEGENVAVTMVLPFLSGEIIYSHAKARVVRIRMVNKIKSASLGFTEISDKDRQTIIRYCFEKQRETRRKERL
ncbi:uncharacterized protein JNUCC1_03645 [Lentibacillus sp. JNUCC-1]|uniref:flagellar brake protein n=1 Tax=Lentibacillus sp. JNUCC-1 TaxID=2654513 RepID=UPI0013297CF6|nr:PilZ domain-containing protein [Lentibacillus sp. JNUCC-1]MUV39761.1 uncharacterized protein [Lentibacillus sp. JNUCC-1]